MYNPLTGEVVETGKVVKASKTLGMGLLQTVVSTTLQFSNGINGTLHAVNNIFNEEPKQLK